jgi:hypothetical protein
MTEVKVGKNEDAEMQYYGHHSMFETLLCFPPLSLFKF